MLGNSTRRTEVWKVHVQPAVVDEERVGVGVFNGCRAATSNLPRWLEVCKDFVCVDDVYAMIDLSLISILLLDNTNFNYCVVGLMSPS